MRHTPPVTASIRNRDERKVRLAREITVQRDTGNSWKRVAEIHIRASCDSPAPEGCVPLVPGAELRPPPWLARQGAAQCSCDDCPPARDGRYRFLVQTCNGTHRISGDPFTIPAAGKGVRESPR